MKPEVTVVGAGPAGSVAAKKASSRFDTAIHGEPNRDVKCAGIISVDGLRKLGLDRKEYLLNTVRGAYIHSPSGVKVAVDAGFEKARVIDRGLFDRMLYDEALDAGARPVPGYVKPQDASSLPGGRVVVATGTDYGIHKRVGLGAPNRFLVGAQYEMKADMDDDFVEVYFNVPGFFSWIIPVGDYARIGLCS